MLKIIFSWIQSHIVSSVIIGVVVITGAIAIPVVLLNDKDTVSDNEQQPENISQHIILKKELTFEVNSELSLLSLVDESNTAKILSEDVPIDTSILGKKEITIKYLDNEETKEHNFEITIVDTTKPIIEFQKSLSTTVGTNIDLLKGVKVSDNSNEDIEVIIEGKYNFDAVGTYNLKYVAVDSSGNKAEESFVLKINKKQSNNSNTSNNNTSNNNGSNNNNTSNVDKPVDNTPPKPADPLKKYCDNRIAGYSNESGVCVDLYPDEHCSYGNTCFGEPEPQYYEDYPGGKEQYDIDLKNWKEQMRSKAQGICSGRGYGWIDAFDKVFGNCTW